MSGGGGTVQGAPPAGGPDAKKASRDRWSFRLGALAIGLLLAFGIGEVVARGVELARGLGHARHDWEGNIFEFCASRHHRLLPDGVWRHSSREYDYIWRNNSLGMRDRKRDLKKAPGSFRILVLGDSMIQGHGVALENTMTMRLEARLNDGDRRGPREVLNAGVFGYSPFLEWLYLREIMDRVEPDLVMVGFFLGNDVGEDHFYTTGARIGEDGTTISFHDQEWPWSLIETALDGGSVAAGSGGGGGSSSASWFLDLKSVAHRSRLLTMVKTVVDAERFPARREREFELVRQRRGDVRYDLGFVNYDVLSRQERLNYWGVSLGYLQEMATLCRRHGIPMVLLVIPPAERILGQTRFEEPYQVLDDLGRRLDVPVIDLLPGFLSRDANALYFKYDRHWTPEGHRLAAELVDRELHRLRLLPDGARP